MPDINLNESMTAQVQKRDILLLIKDRSKLLSEFVFISDVAELDTEIKHLNDLVEQLKKSSTDPDRE